MKLLVVVTTLVAIATARPDVGLAYNYQPPSTRYGVPISPSVPSGSYIPSVPTNRLQTPVHPQVSFTGSVSSPTPVSAGHNERITIVGGGAFNRGHQVASTPESIFKTGTFESRTSANADGQQGGFGTGSFGLDTSGFSGGQQGGFSSGISGFTGGTQQSYTNYNTQAEVQKHLYFFSAPNEPEEIRPRVNVPIIAPKKNVKILFIKAPSYAAPAPVNIPVQPQNEEKTLVYVLVKKPEEQAEINIPAPIPTQPTKPEVFFIKYKTQSEAEEAISNVQQGHGHGGSVSATSSNSNIDFINTIKSDISKTLDTRFSSGVHSHGSLPVSHLPVSPLPTSPVGSTTTTSIINRNDISEDTGSELYGPPGDSGPY